ncbi:MAG: response regulator, partial [Verrucomicrobiales bacterium]
MNIASIHSQGQSGEQHQAATTESVRPAKPKILIVDDEGPICRVAEAILDSIGIETIIASSGEEAVKLYQASAGTERTIDLVVMDLALPGGMSGLETAELLRAIDSRVKIILSSGYLEPTARATAIENGFAGI